MFYSQTFLARKGPLSTVWIAAHLQHRLKKTHYTSTDIPSTVERIMDPEVPIALRMSGHLLLGVVRIYSKKVDYLFQDCNVVLTGLSKAFASIQLALPEEASQAPFHSITVPETFYLDALHVDNEFDYDGVEDVHLKSQEEITLTDRIPVLMDHYVAISFDEVQPYSLNVAFDIMMDSSHTEVLPDSGAIPMEEDIIAQSPSMNVVLGAEDHGPVTQRQSPTIQCTGGDTSGFGPGDNSSPQALPVETVRDLNNDHNNVIPPVLQNLEDADANPSIDLDRTTKENDNIPEIVVDLDCEGRFASSQQHSGPPTPDNSQRGTSDAQPSGENDSLNFVIRESPPIQQPQRRGRKRKQFFDQPIVLSNEHMRKALKNTRDIRRKRKDVPSSNLGTWKLNNSRRKEDIFYQPLFTGLCQDLLDISKSEYVRSKPHLIISEEDHAARIATMLSPTSQTPEEPLAVTDPVTASDMEIEQPRNVASTPPPIVLADEVVEGDYRSPDRRDGLSSASHLNLGSVSETVQTLDLAASPGVRGSETIQTPVSAASPGFHEFMTIQTPDFDTHPCNNSAEADELSFLEKDNTPASSHATSGSINSLSQTTWRVARHLKELSPITPISEEPAEDLSLNKILEGKKRKVSARMFFEVLVGSDF
ncbi:hypothetical protein VNO77_26734 [Canavalia gladiata]|uniref:Rad21/Rec8-like protein N-terminal domain-containing protein n=1 Tax=Canavalia gladiata TaxID=3824 RepID=A0AAN9Q6J3_CANGL